MGALNLHDMKAGIQERDAKELSDELQRLFTAMMQRKGRGTFFAALAHAAGTVADQAGSNVAMFLAADIGGMDPAKLTAMARPSGKRPLIIQ